MNSRLDQLLNFHKENPKDSFLLFALAKEYEGLGQVGNALFHYQELVKSDPEYIGTYYHLGKLQQQQGTFEQAMATFETGIAMAQQIKDRHALGELNAAKMDLEDLMEE
ncbi:MAG: tetratricopeptide repeat protein [Bacteroidota bacterium]